MKKTHKKLRTSLIIIGVLFFAYAVPLPFKPSLWADLHRWTINKQIKKSTAAVYLPDAADYPKQRFEIYAGWVDTYAIQVSDGMEKGAYYYQIKPGQLFKASGEGLSDRESDALNQVISMTNCEYGDGIVELCEVPAREFKTGRMTTKVSAEKFARLKKDDVILVTELTTNSHMDGYIIKDGTENFNYIEKDLSERQAIIATLEAAKPRQLASVMNLFDPQF